MKPFVLPEEFKKKKIILHLCADIGSDSRYFQLDDNFAVIRIGVDIGVENFTYDGEVYGVIANPPCTEFSTARYDITRDTSKGMSLVEHCLRIIEEVNPKFWVMENPAKGTLHKFIGKPKHIYHPWQYGNPWTKMTALWGEFNMPTPLHSKWEEVTLNPDIYVRAGRKPSLAVLHKSAIQFMPEYSWCADRIKCDADIRSLCSDGFAKALYLANKDW